jgi:GT2 family glycosyltransferase
VLRRPIVEHLQRDGLPVPESLGDAGVARVAGDAAPADEAATPATHRGNEPKCVRERRRALADAPLATVIVATHDRPRYLDACLRSLTRLVYPRYEIVVVDNAPTTDETARLVRETYGDVPNLRYEREDRPGTSRARNRGLARARGEIVAFTDDDAVADPLWLAELVRAFSVCDGVGCVTGLILPSELETPSQVLFEQFGGFAKGFRRRVYDLGPNRPPDGLFPYTAGKFGSGPNMAFNTAALRDIGGFDVALGGGTPVLGGEDLAAYYGIIRRGHQLVYEPAALVWHAHRDTYAALRHQLFGYGSGLSAFLTKSVVDDPSSIWELLRKVPAGVLYTLHPASPKNRNKTADYPRDLLLAELKGMAYGPFAYLAGRRRSRVLANGRRGRRGRWRHPDAASSEVAS